MSSAKAKVAEDTRPMEERVHEALSLLREFATEHDFANLERFGITVDKAFGVSVGNIQKVAKQIGRSHELAEALWQTGWYEARMLCAFVDEPAKVTPEQMERWCADFDNWGICDTLCFKLWDQLPFAWDMVDRWSKSPELYAKRTAFALMWSLAAHDKGDAGEPFLHGLKLIEEAAFDDRHFVIKAVNMALRCIGRRSVALNNAAVDVARRLAESNNSSARWVGKDALKELTSEAVQERMK